MNNDEDLYSNLLRATDNTEDISVEKWATITKTNNNLCNVKETETGLEHTNVPIMNNLKVIEGDTVLLGFINNNLYDPVVYGVVGRDVGASIIVDDELSLDSINPVQNKIITSAINNKANTVHNHNITDVDDLQTNLNNKADKVHTHLSEQITDLIDVIYPVGSIYMSVNNINPATLFGGSWERIKDTFLLASGDTYSNGSSGGEATHTLTESEMPSHRHTQYSYYSTGTGSSGAYMQTNNRATTRVNTDYSGGGQAHNNMPPYLAVNVWKRIN